MKPTSPAKETPLKIAIVMPVGEQRGGGELMLTHLMQQGQNAGVEWLVIFLEDGPMVGQLRDLGATVTVMPAGRLRQPHRMLRTLLRMAALLKKERIDLVCGWMAKAQLYAGPAARLAGVASVWYQLSTPDDKTRLDRTATRMPAKGVITLSKDGLAAQKELRPSLPIRLVYPGVELERFNPDILPTPAEARAKLGLPPNGPLIGIVGRLQYWKGIHTVIEAMPLVRQTHPDAICVVVGGKHDLEADYETRLHKQIADLHLEDVVIMAGLQRNVPEWMQAMDIIVHASHSEPFGIVIIEAMALGKPVVAGNLGGPTEIITEGVNGLLTPFEDAPALAQAIRRYLDDPEFARRTGEAARCRAADYSTRRYALALIDAFRDLLA